MASSRKEINQAANAAIRAAFGRGPQAEAQRQGEDRERQIDDLDEQITQRQAQLDRLIERRDSMLFENGGKDAKG